VGRADLLHALHRARSYWEKVKRQVPGGALEQRRDARHFAGEDRVPSHAELFV